MNTEEELERLRARAESDAKEIVELKEQQRTDIQEIKRVKDQRDAAEAACAVIREKAYALIECMRAPFDERDTCEISNVRIELEEALATDPGTALARVQAAEADTKRLDYLEMYHFSRYPMPAERFSQVIFTDYKFKDSIREAIDAAMKEAK